MRLSKQQFQTRSLAIQRLAFLLEFNQNESMAQIMSFLLSPIGHDDGHKNPYKWTDNYLLGQIEKEIKRIEDGDSDEE